MFIKAIVLALLVKILLSTRSPGLCAGLYGAGYLMLVVPFKTAAGATAGTVALTLLVLIGAAYGFFKLLDQVESTPLLYWIVLVLGSIVLIVL